MTKNKVCSTRRERSGSLLILAALVTCLWAGAVAADSQEQTQPAAKPATTSPKTPTTAKGPTTSKVSKTAKAPTTPQGKAPATVPAPKAAAKATPTKRARAKPKTSGPPVPKLNERAAYSNQRDPFKPLVYASMTGPQTSDLTGPLPPGMRGLVIGQLMLEGIVRQDTTNTMIAVVANETKRAYFLRESDAVYNGVVRKITPDAVYFQENFVDLTGRVGTREVVKRMVPAPGETK